MLDPIKRRLEIDYAEERARRGLQGRLWPGGLFACRRQLLFLLLLNVVVVALTAFVVVPR